MQKVVYYARVSTEEEKQLDSLKSQVSELRDFILKQKDWILIDEYIDEGKSGTDRKGRNEYNRMFEDLSENKFDLVVVKDQSRLMRNVKDWYIFIDRMISNKKQLFFKLDNSYYSSNDTLYTGIKAILAEEYSRDLSKKLNSAHLRRAQEGSSVITNGSMWGYEQKNGQLCIKEKEADIVRMVFDMYINRMGFRTILKKFADMGIMSKKGTPFSATTLKRMIKNEKYMGTLICNKRHKDFDTKMVIDVPKNEWYTHEGVIPPIVSEETWHKANEICSEKKKIYKNDKDKNVIAGYFKGSHLYSSKIICGKCGEPFWHDIYGKNKTEIWMCKKYKSYGKNHKLGCNNTRIMSKDIDDVVKEVIFGFWENKDVNINRVLEVLSESLKVNSEEDQIRKLQSELSKIQHKKEKLFELYTNEAMNIKEYKTKNMKFDEEVEAIEKNLSELKMIQERKEDKASRLLNIKEFLTKKLSKKEELTDEIIENFLHSVVVNPDKTLVITLNGNLEYKASIDGYKYLVCPNVSTTRQD